MPSYSMLILPFALLVLLLTSQYVSAVPVEDACTKKAYGVYDFLTVKGCGTLVESECRALFELAVRNLNADLDKCNPQDYVTLCRVKPVTNFFSFEGCSTVGDGAKLTKADCEAKASQDYTFYGADGSKTFYEAKNSKCINAVDYNCHQLCR